MSYICLENLMQKFHKLYTVQILCTFDFISPECTAKSLFIHARMELLALNKWTTKVHRLQTESFVKIVPRNYLVIFKQTNITARVCLS